MEPTLAEDPARVGSVVRQFGYHEHVFTFTERTWNESLEAAAKLSESTAKIGPKKGLVPSRNKEEHEIGKGHTKKKSVNTIEHAAMPGEQIPAVLAVRRSL